MYHIVNKLNNNYDNVLRTITLKSIQYEIFSEQKKSMKLKYLTRDFETLINTYKPCINLKYKAYSSYTILPTILCY